MDHATRGIILRTHPFSETSLIVRWLTPDRGRMATMARGALRPKSTFRGRLDLYYLGHFSFTPSRRGTLHTLKEVRLLETFENLRRHYAALEHAAYATRLIERITETDTPLPGLFELLDDFLRLVGVPSPGQLNVVTLELRLLDWSGQAPDLRTSDLSPGAQSLCQQLLRAPARLRRQLQPTSRQAQEIHRFLQDCLQSQFDIPPGWRTTALG
jgi:DNA repair protein RecO (recombination protein O)